MDGKVKIKIPEGTQTGKLFRLKGKGVKKIRSSNVGDLMCRVIVETPQRLDSKQKNLLKEFDTSIKDKRNNPLSSEWFNKVKSFFDNK